MLFDNLCSAEIFTHDDVEAILTSAVEYLAVKGEHEFLSLKDVFGAVRLTCNDILTDATVQTLKSVV